MKALVILVLALALFGCDGSGTKSDSGGKDSVEITCYQWDAAAGNPWHVALTATLHVKSRKEAALRSAKLLEEYAKQLDQPLKPEAEPEVKP